MPKTKFINTSGLDKNSIKHKNYNIMIFIDDFGKIIADDLEDFLIFCIQNGVKSIYLMGYNSKKIEDMCDNIIMNTYLENNEDKKYLDIITISENIIKNYSTFIYMFVNDSINNKINYNYIFTINETNYNYILENLNNKS